MCLKMFEAHSYVMYIDGDGNANDFYSFISGASIGIAAVQSIYDTRLEDTQSRKNILIKASRNGKS